MKFISTILLLLFCNSIVFAETISGLVVGVADGDTITVLDGTNTQHKIRLMGIDAPEKKQAFGNVAKKALSDLVYKKQVTIDYNKTDRYQRLIGKVILNNVDVNLVMVTQGLAWHYVKYQNEQTLEDRGLYAQAELDSRLLKRGLWLDKEQIAPWDFRKLSKTN
jgi:endonuclease YncB( thermonuclease family)